MAMVHPSLTTKAYIPTLIAGRFRCVGLARPSEYIFASSIQSYPSRSHSADHPERYIIISTLTVMMDQPQSLRTLFASAKTEKESLESRTDSNSDSYRSDVDATIAKFKECQRLVQFLSLFSQNESLEEVATGDIPYLFPVS